MKKTYNLKLNSIEMELSEEEVQNLLNQLAVGTPTHKRKYFVPKDDEYFYFIDNNGFITKQTFDCDWSMDIGRIKQGNCFATEQDAQDELNRRQAIVRIWNNYDDKYSWDIDWSNRTQQKHYIGYSHYSIYPLTEDFHSYSMQAQFELPYFKSAEDRNQFVEDNRDDLLVVFNIKK